MQAAAFALHASGMHSIPACLDIVLNVCVCMCQCQRIVSCVIMDTSTAGGKGIIYLVGSQLRVCLFVWPPALRAQAPEYDENVFVIYIQI